MPHCTPEDLALAALGEPLRHDDAAHLASCETCRAEVASLRRGVEALAIPEFAAPGAAVTPPPAVWSAIAEATGVTATPRSVAPADEAPARPESETPLAPVTALRRRRPRVLLAVAAALVGAVVGAGTVVLLQRADQGATVAQATLDPLEGKNGSGKAEVVERDGQQLLEIQFDAPQLTDAYYEVWLLQPSVEGLVPLGSTRPGKATFEIPDGLDLKQYPLVDVSIEPLDGNPAHSGDSVVRGELSR